jgi:ankyrin repeat protein
VSLQDDDSWTPLSWAARKGCDTAVKLLLDTVEIDVDSKDYDG